MNTTAVGVYTIGHSTHSAEAFLALLRQHAVDAVADVRSSPFSRFNPQFNREALERSLKANGIRYVSLGKELGARSEDRSCYLDGRVQYARLALTPLFRSGLDRVGRGAQRFRIALMCAEKEPLACHRTLLVATALVARGLPVLHIHADGHLETHEGAMDRLLDLTDVPKGDLFRSKEDLLAEALARQERQIAYVDEAQAPPVLRQGPAGGSTKAVVSSVDSIRRSKGSACGSCCVTTPPSSSVLPEAFPIVCRHSRPLPSPPDGCCSFRASRLKSPVQPRVWPSAATRWLPPSPMTPALATSVQVAESTAWKSGFGRGASLSSPLEQPGQPKGVAADRLDQ